MFIYFRGGVKSEKRRSVGGEVKKIPQKRAGGVPVRLIGLLHFSQPVGLLFVVVFDVI